MYMIKKKMLLYKYPDIDLEKFKEVEQMKKPEIKYVAGAMSANYLGSFHCGICQRENLSVKNFARLCLGLDIISPFGRPSEFMPKDQNRWVRM